MVIKRYFLEEKKLENDFQLSHANIWECKDGHVRPAKTQISLCTRQSYQSSLGAKY